MGKKSGLYSNYIAVFIFASNVEPKLSVESIFWLSFEGILPKIK